MSGTSPYVLVLCDDLMFASRIAATARSLGDVTVRTVRSVTELEKLGGEEKPACVIIDLASAGLSVSELVPRFRQQGAAPLMVAYGSHVDSAALTAARAAGCDVVLPRSKFVEQLPTALPRWLAGES